MGQNNVLDSELYEKGAKAIGCCGGAGFKRIDEATDIICGVSVHLLSQGVVDSARDEFSKNYDAMVKAARNLARASSEGSLNWKVSLRTVEFLERKAAEYELFDSVL